MRPIGNRIAGTQLLAGAAKNVSTTVRNVPAGPVWELWDGENADPARAPRATPPTSRRGPAGGALPNEACCQNAKRKRCNGVAGDDTGSDGTTSDSTLADRPRKKARYDLAGLGFPAPALSEIPEGIDACVGKAPIMEKSGNRKFPLCRLAGCEKIKCGTFGQGPTKDYFCYRCFNKHAGEKGRLILAEDGFPVPALSEVPEGVDACAGKAPKTRKSGEKERSLCRLAGCEKTKCENFGSGPARDTSAKDAFMTTPWISLRSYLHRKWSRRIADRWDGKAFPGLNHTAVPANVDANVGNAPVRNEDGLMLCRLAACNRSKCTVPGQGKGYEYFCTACYTQYLKVNQLYFEKMDRLHAEKVRAGDTVNKTLRRHLLDQSFDAETDGDANVHLAKKKMLFHFTAAESLQHWECNNSGEIQLKPNKYLKRETLDEHTPHWPNMPGWKREEPDPKVWATTSFLGGWKFIADHHGCPPEKGTVWHVPVFTWRNGAYKTFRQHRWNGRDISPNHELMCESTGRDAVPCLVLRLEFQDEDVANAQMTVVRVNGDGATVEDIDAEDPGFKITEEKISWSRYLS